MQNFIIIIYIDDLFFETNFNMVNSYCTKLMSDEY